MESWAELVVMGGGGLAYLETHIPSYSPISSQLFSSLLTLPSSPSQGPMSGPMGFACSEWCLSEDDVSDESHCHILVESETPTTATFKFKLEISLYTTLLLHFKDIEA